MKEQQKAQLEIIIFFFHTMEEDEIKQVCNNLNKCLEQKQKNSDTANSDDYDYIKAFVKSIEEFISYRFHSTDSDLKSSCENYSFYKSIGTLGFNTDRYLHTNLEKLTLFLLDIDKKLKNLNLDKKSKKDIKEFINNYISNLHIFLDSYKELESIREQCKALDKETNMKLVSSHQKNINADITEENDVIK